MIRDLRPSKDAKGGLSGDDGPPLEHANQSLGAQSTIKKSGETKQGEKRKMQTPKQKRENKKTKKEPKLKVRDLKPSKDAKGGDYPPLKDPWIP
jgi:hypothetical protein